MIININYSKNPFFNYLMILLPIQPYIYYSSSSGSVIFAIFDILRKACNLFKVLITVRGNIWNSKLIFADNRTNPHISCHGFWFKQVFFKLWTICIILTWGRAVFASKFWLVFSQEYIFIHSFFLVTECRLFLLERVPEIFSLLVNSWCY